MENLEPRDSGIGITDISKLKNLLHLSELPQEKFLEFLKEIYSHLDDLTENAYAPYSNFKVTSILLIRDLDGNLIKVTGVNVENASYGLSVCAERVAVFKAISEGYHPHNGYEWLGIFIYTPNR